MLIKLSERLVLNTGAMLYMALEEDSDNVVVMFSGPGPEDQHRLELTGGEARAMRRFLEARTVTAEEVADQVERVAGVQG